MSGRRCALTLLVTIAGAIAGCPTDRACESAADCPDPARQVCSAATTASTEGPIEACEAATETECIASPRGCVCIVGSWALDMDAPRGRQGLICID